MIIGNSYRTMSEVEANLKGLIALGYKNVKINEGTLLDGDYICIPPTKEDSYIVFKEIPINCWQSVYLMEAKGNLTDVERNLLNTAENWRA